MLYKYYPPERLDVIEGLEVHFSSPSKFNDAVDTYHLLPRTSNPKVKMGRSKLSNEMGVLCLTERPGPSLKTIAANCEKWIYQTRPFSTRRMKMDGSKAPESKYEEEWLDIRRFTTDEYRTATRPPVKPFTPTGPTCKSGIITRLSIGSANKAALAI